MRIGIDCRNILHPEKGGVGGIGRYIHEIVGALLTEAPEHEFVLFFDHQDAISAKKDLLAGHDNVTVRVLPFHLLRKMPLFRSHAIASMLFAREKLDLLHGPANAIPLFYSGPSVVTLHDLAIYDHPEWFPDVVLGKGTFSTRVIVPRSVEVSRRVIAVSLNTKRDAIRIFGCDGWKIDVVHEGAEVPRLKSGGAKVLSMHGLKERGYVLSLSTIEPRKNIPALVEAFSRAAADGRLLEETKLIIVGAQGWKCETTFAAIAAAQIALGKDRVRWLGRVTEDEKWALIANAAVFAFPSFYEGFGLPPLEAMALGTPVVASALSSLPEVCGRGATLVDPYDIDGLSEAISEIFADPIAAANLAEKGKERAAGFTWKKAAQETLAVYERALRA